LEEGGSCGNEVLKSMSQRKIWDNPLHNVLERQSIRIGFDGWKRGMMRSSTSFDSVANNSFQKFVFEFCLYLSFIVLFFKSEYPDFGNFEEL